MFQPVSRRSFFAFASAAGVCLLLAVPPQGAAQSTFSGRLRPFVTGVIPVVGNSGVVGGVSVDPEGVLRRGEVDQSGELRKQWESVLARVPSDLQRPSKLRKISLRRLEREVAGCIDKRQPLPDELALLAGIQRVEYLFVFPDENDLVLAGPAESWKAGEQGEVVGVNTGRPVLRLEDLLVALRTADAASESPGISCSIDPTEGGLRRFQQVLAKARRGARPPANQVAALEKALGPQPITVTGVALDSHFARVMVGADYVMKRIAMKLEPSPLAELPSYLEMIDKQRLTGSLGPRFWLAVDYDSLLASDDGLAWKLEGSGVRAMSEAARVTAQGDIVAEDGGDGTERRWAELMTRHYGELARRVPVFGQLQGCIDLAVIAALIRSEGLLEAASCPLELLHDAGRLTGATYVVPKTVESRASLVQPGMIAVSGGVEIDVSSILDRATKDPRLGALHRRSRASDERWWWD